MTILLQVKNLNKNFPITSGLFKREVGSVKAVNDVSFSLKKGEVLGVVGESGCGKTSLGRTLVRLYDPSSGSIVFKGENLVGLSNSDLRPYRRSIQMIFQDPYSSLNPRMSIQKILEEPLTINKIGDKAYRQRRVEELIETVGLSKPCLTRFPHEFSGGQRQRIAIARAISLNPELIIADEPVSALDVSIQSQILNLLVDLQKKLDLAVVFISHDLLVVKYISDRIAVMYLGFIVEIGPAASVFERARHPYTQALTQAIPRVGQAMDLAQHDDALEGELPSPIDLPTGCPFRTRCKYQKPLCSKERPKLKKITDAKGVEHEVACHFEEEISKRENLA